MSGFVPAPFDPERVPAHRYEAAFVAVMAALPHAIVVEIRESIDEPGAYQVFQDPRVDDDVLDGVIWPQDAYEAWRASYADMPYKIRTLPVDDDPTPPWMRTGPVRTPHPEPTRAELDALANAEREREAFFDSGFEANFCDDDALYGDVLDGHRIPSARRGRIVYRRGDAPAGADPLAPDVLHDLGRYPAIASVFVNACAVRIVGMETSPFDNPRVELACHPAGTLETYAGRGNEHQWLAIVHELLLHCRNVGLPITMSDLGKSLRELAPPIPVDDGQIVFCKHCNEPLRLGDVRWAQYIVDRGEAWHYCSHEHQARYRYARAGREKFAQEIAEAVERYARHYRCAGCRVDHIDMNEVEKVLCDWCANEPFRGPMRPLVVAALSERGFSGRSGHVLYNPRYNHLRDRPFGDGK